VTKGGVGELLREWRSHRRISRLGDGKVVENRIFFDRAEFERKLGDFDSVDERDREVVAAHDSEQDRVEAVDEAAVRAEEPAGVLDLEVAFDHRGE
jgi:hypothetical protein